MPDVKSMMNTLNQFASSGGTYWRLQTQRAVIRILPPVPGKTPQDSYFLAAHQHMMSLDGGTRSFRCLEDLEDWCPVCAAHRIFEAIGTKKWEDKAAELRPQAKFSMNIILQGKANRGKIFIWQATPGAVKQILERHNGEWGDPSDPEDGWWFELSKKGDGKGTRYTVTPSPKGIGALPSWVDLDDVHKLTGDFITVKKRSTLKHAMIEKYADQYPELEDELRADFKKWSRKHSPPNGKTVSKARRKVRRKRSRGEG